MPNILATQSHVVHGYVGNKAATFPLQCLNWNIDALNVVQFSNHTGYGSFIGSTIPQEDLDRILRHLLAMPRLVYNALLTGYLPNKECVRTVLTQYNEYKNKLSQSQEATGSIASNSCLWLLDPVMGDEYQLYVNADVIPEYKTFLGMNNIDIITPNSFELELLYNKDLQFMEEHNKALTTGNSERPPLIPMDRVFEMLGSLHENVKFIVVTSLDNVEVEGADRDQYVYCLASWHRDCGQKYLFRVPKIKSYFTGVGDLFSSILLHSLHSSNLFANSNKLCDRQGADLEKEIVYCINYTLTILQQVLAVTVESRKSAMGGSDPLDCGELQSAEIGGDPMVMKNMELKIIEAKDVFLSTNSSNVKNFLYKKVKS